MQQVPELVWPVILALFALVILHIYLDITGTSNDTNVPVAQTNENSTAYRPITIIAKSDFL